MPKASKGRIVHVLVDPAFNGGDDVAPAVITRVWSDEMVNVRLLLDSDPAFYGPQGERRTSVPLKESREALDEAQRARSGDEDAAATFGAFWPPHT